MKPAPFEYLAPTSLDEVLQMLNEHGYDGKLLAGGQSLVPVMNFRLAQPTILIDLNGVDELTYLNVSSGGGLFIGAMTRQRILEHDAVIAAKAPLLHETMPFIAHAQIRNRGTIGGSLSHADPAAELPVITVALEAKFKLQRVGQSRWVNAEDFYAALFTTALEPEEILTEISIPSLPANTGWAFQELARRHGDYAQVGVAALVTLDAAGNCRGARLVYLNVGEVPMIASKATAVLQGEKPTDSVIEAAAHLAADEEIDPTTDMHATAVYKRHLAYVLGKRTLKQAVERAQERIQS
ncbi:MAG: xanthine dehydrogenase family protein subunit M [Anaerolineales bacterium]|nr:xanthine dehydrogenase family protein subunit M [Anaerolineales bacterium]